MNVYDPTPQDIEDALTEHFEKEDAYWKAYEKYQEEEYWKSLEEIYNQY